MALHSKKPTCVNLPLFSIEGKTNNQFRSIGISGNINKNNKH